MPPFLPIDALLPDIAKSLAEHPNLVLRAATGAGKTTRVPPALLDADWARRGTIFVVEPRRLAARAAARRMAHELGSPLGDAIGYHVRFDRQAGPATRLLVVTPGILLRRLHDDPGLEQASAVLFDEFHERGLESDLALGMTRLLQQTIRPELRLVAMSATFDTERVAEYLGGCPVLTSEGRSFPVEIRYEPATGRPWLSDLVADAIMRNAATTSGDLLAFLPGVGEIRQTASALRSWAEAEEVLVVPLFGDLPPEQQDLALRTQPGRRVVLATNVAETSVTVEGITVVIDSGLARQQEYDPAVGLDRLKLTPISRASADQRAGRAGRTQAGLCVRLWNEMDQRSRPAQTEPEIRRVDLAGPALQLLSLGEKDLGGFPWLESPKPAALEQAVRLLDRLGATKDGAVTELGRRMARLPTHPRLGRFLIEGARLGAAEPVALAAALLSERDPFQSKGGRGGPTQSDLLDRIDALRKLDARGGNDASLGEVNIAAARFLLRARDQFLRSLRDEAERFAKPPNDIDSEEMAVTRALLTAFPDRLARRRDGDPRRGVMVGGRGVRLMPQSGVLEGELFLCLDIDAGETESLVRMASAVPRDWIPASQLTSRNVVVFDEEAERVVGRKRISFDDLLIEEGQAHLDMNEETARVLGEAAAKRIDRVLPPPDSAAGGFLARLRWLREWMPELELPAFDDAESAAMVPWLCPGRKSFHELRHADWLGLISGRLTPRQRQTIDREAPERLTVPSGSSIGLVYELGKPPVLAVRIQEIFGMADTPRLAAGRVKLILHLLAPNNRPQQITDDLASFWKTTYPLVRKDLRIRYPKHAWPEDPWSEPPRRGPKRRGP